MNYIQKLDCTVLYIQFFLFLQKCTIFYIFLNITTYQSCKQCIHGLDQTRQQNLHYCSNLHLIDFQLGEQKHYLKLENNMTQ